MRMNRTGKALGLYDLQNMIPQWKAERPSLKTRSFACSAKRQYSG